MLSVFCLVGFVLFSFKYLRIYCVAFVTSIIYIFLDLFWIFLNKKIEI